MNYYIQDLWGNTYVLKSLNAVNSTPELVEQAVADAVLPLGWTKLAGSYFSEDVTFSPSYSGDGNSIAHANEFRDSADSAWMQIEWGSLGMTLNAAAEGGLPIWAGPKGGLLLGTHNDDNLYGAQGHDLLYAGAGNDALDGGQGLNHAIFVGDESQYEVIRISDDTVQIADQIQDRDGTDSLTRVQRADFADYSVGFDVQAGQSTGVAYRMYGVLDRVPDLEGLGYWIADFDNGLGLIGMAQSFLDSKEYVQAHENGLTDDQFLTQLYEDVLKRNPDEAGNQYWLQQLANGASRASVLVGFTESNESIELYAGQLDNGASYVGWWT
jgi:hypothetical protein